MEEASWSGHTRVSLYSRRWTVKLFRLRASSRVAPVGFFGLCVKWFEGKHWRLT